jgi:Glyoxalase-like domain
MPSAAMQDARPFDHFVIATRDAQVAGEQYERLGFHVLPLQRHIEIGSCNRLFQLEQSYVELLGDVDKSLPLLRDRMMPRFLCGEGLALTSLNSDNLERDRELLQGQGFRPDPIINARRAIRLPSGMSDETDSRCFYNWYDEHPYMTLFLSKHYKPHTIWIPQYMAHPNTTVRVTGQTFLISSPKHVIPYLRAMLHAEPSSISTARVEFHTSREESLEIISPQLLNERYGELAWALCPAPSGYGTSLRYRVHDLHACRRVLSASGVRFIESDGVLRVAADRGAGVISEFSVVSNA